MPRTPSRWPANQRPVPGQQIDWTHWLSRNLVLWIAHNEGAGGRTADLTGRSSVTTNSGWLASNMGPAINFPAAGASTLYTRAKYTPDYDFGTGDFAVEIVFTQRGAGAAEWLIGKDDGGSNRDWGLRVGGTAQVIDWFDFHTVNANNLTGAIINTGIHYHFLATRIGTTLTGYLNGAPQLAVTRSTSYTATVDLTCGQRLANDISFNGTMECARLWKGRGFSAQEAMALYENPYENVLPLRVTRSYSAPAGGFQAAWAKGANRLISGGVWGG